MPYMSIVMNLLQERPAMYETLRRESRLLSALNQYAKDLKASHEAWTAELSEAKPLASPALIASQAMELALQELVDRLPSESTPSDDPLSLDQAIAYVRRHSPRG